LGTGYLSLVTCCWVLVAGFWFLPICFCLLPIACSLLEVPELSASWRIGSGCWAVRLPTCLLSYLPTAYFPTCPLPYICLSRSSIFRYYALSLFCKYFIFLTSIFEIPTFNSLKKDWPYLKSH